MAHRQYPYLPYGLCVGTFMVSLPAGDWLALTPFSHLLIPLLRDVAGISPMPYTMTLLSCILFFFGTYQTIPVFVSVLTSYTIITGSGLMKKVTLKQQENEVPLSLLASLLRGSNIPLFPQKRRLQKEGAAAPEGSNLAEKLLAKKEEDEYALSKYMSSLSAKP